MGSFLRRGGEPGTTARRGRAVLVAVGALVALGAVAVDVLALTVSHDPARATRGAVPSRASGSAHPADATSVGTQGAPAATSAFRQIILPDLLVVAPGGLAAGQAAQLRALAGVRNMITFDGAQITAGGRKV